MPYARVDGIDLWYERSGGDGPTLVLTHGFASPSDFWPPVIDEFRRRFDLVLYDVRAHGRSGIGDPADVTVPQFARDLAGLLDVLGIARAHVGGVSMGGMISAQFACDFPDRLRSLALCDTTAGNRAGPDAQANDVEAFVVDAFERMASIAEKRGLEELARRENAYRHESDPYAHLAALSLEEQDAKNLRTKREAMTVDGYLAANRALGERPDLTPCIPQVRVPTLVSCGDWDRFYACARRDHALIPGSRFVTIRAAAHSTPDYQPQLWKRAVFDFIADVEAGRDTLGELELAPEPGA